MPGATLSINPMGAPIPDAAGIDRSAHTNIHIGVLEHDVAFDQQFL